MDNELTITELSAWLNSQRLSPVLKSTATWLLSQVQGYDADITLSSMSNALHVSPSGAYSRLWELSRRELVVARPIGTTRIKRRYLVEFRYPGSPAEMHRQMEIAARYELMAEFVAGAAERRRRWAEREAALQAGTLRIEDVMGR